MALKSARLRDAARALRRRPTEAETRLWGALRNRGLGGWKFRRQAAVGPFVVDFLCVEARLVVEVDGGRHAENPADIARDALLRARGYDVVRYWNHEALGNLEGVLADLTLRLAQAANDPSPRPSPPQAGERGRAVRRRRSPGAGAAASTPEPRL